MSDRKRAIGDAVTNAASSPPKPKRVKKKNMDPSVLEFRRTIHLCCASDDLMTAIEAYDDAVAKETRIEAQSFYSLLSLCDGLGDRGVHIGTPKSRATSQKTDKEKGASPSVRIVDMETRQKYAFRVKKHMEDLKFPLNETAYTALVKLLSKTEQFDEAEKLLTAAEGTQQCRPKLRMFSPLLVAYCDTGQLDNALSIWRRVIQQDLTLSEKEYASLIRCSTSIGDALVMERVLTDLSEDILVPSRETCTAIVRWFQSPSSNSCGKGNGLHQTPSLQKSLPHQQDNEAVSMGPVQCQNEDGWEINEACTIDTVSGALQTGCLSGAKLKPVSLSESARQQMKQMNSTIALSGKLVDDNSDFQGGKKGRKIKVGNMTREERKRHWSHFEVYLSRRCQRDRHLDVVIDGANVGYFDQNYPGAPKHVHYEQIDWVVQHFLRLNKTILLIMHSRHFSPQLLPPEMVPLVRSWERNGVLYKTPPRMNDDWFWLHASLYSGPSTLVVTNDEMRDHHFQMLALRSFLRWKERHQVRFHFGAWERGIYGGNRTSRQVVLTFPDPYSRRIQRVLDGLVVPLPKRGDEHRFLDGSHEADEKAPVEETYMCIRPKPPSQR